MKYFLYVLGLVMVVEGLPYFGFPEKMKFVIQKILEMPDNALRKFGFVLMLAGVWLGQMYLTGGDDIRQRLYLFKDLFICRRVDVYNTQGTIIPPA